MRLSRRSLLAGVAGAAVAGPAAAARGRLPDRATPLPLEDVRLLPSDYATAVETNRRYLLALDPDRLLHNFRKFAGLTPKAAIYGGWEGDTIAGHTLGHYLSALALVHRQTGDATARARADYVVSELAAAQAARGTGYVGALMRKRADKSVVDGEEIFAEIARGDIRSTGFDLNGAWSPLYVVHKLFAGLLDVHAAWGNAHALSVATGLATYFARVFDALDDARMQAVLACEYGGLNESFAELHARDRNPRWLAVAERLYDRRVLDPLAAGEDRLANLHANTQVPKLIGLARIHDLTGKPAPRRAATFFWETVTKRHSYAIGGNADREYFSAPDTIAQHVTEQTCEHCNTYNMLRLTAHLYGWRPDARLFDFYERAHLNHVMAAQNPRTGGFTYMTPLMSGTKREFSDPKDDPFWCCVGTGMEAHAKHGEAIFWQGGDALIVNLYVPARATWRAGGATVALTTRYPFEGEATLALEALARPRRFAVALRVPGWAKDAAVTVNGRAAQVVRERGYAIVERRWRAGDRVAIALPLDLRLEPAPGDPGTVAVMRGPLVMAADLGPADGEWEGADPALVGGDLLAAFAPAAGDARFATRGIGRPGDLAFAPFYRQWDRRSAVYFRRFTDAEWTLAEAGFRAEQARLADLTRRSVDVMHLGEMQPERDHRLDSAISYPVTYRGRQGRDARAGGFFEFDLKTRPGPLVLQATYWGDERPRRFDILVDGRKIATQSLGHERPGEFFDVDYPIPPEAVAGKASVRVRFEPHAKATAGPVFGVRLFTPAG